MASERRTFVLPWGVGVSLTPIKAQINGAGSLIPWYWPTMTIEPRARHVRLRVAFRLEGGSPQCDAGNCLK